MGNQNMLEISFFGRMFRDSDDSLRKTASKTYPTNTQTGYHAMCSFLNYYFVNYYANSSARATYYEIPTTQLYKSTPYYYKARITIPKLKSSMRLVLTDDEVGINSWTEFTNLKGEPVIVTDDADVMIDCVMNGQTYMFYSV